MMVISHRVQGFPDAGIFDEGSRGQVKDIKQRQNVKIGPISVAIRLLF